MEYWEFLLQKEGDRSWLPLESPDVEILEGRYRVVVRTSRANTMVDIRVTHIATEEVPPKRRVQKRSHPTNQEGMIVIFPFTRLYPGIWELRCSGDVMADLLGESWQHSVKLQVVSKDSELAERWEPDWDTDQSALVENSESDSPVEPAPSTAIAIATTNAKDLEAMLNLPTAVPNQAVPQLVIDQETLMAQWGQPFALTGQIAETAVVSLPSSPNLDPWIGELQVCLCDPQTLQVVISGCQPLVLQEFPASFNCTIVIPTDCKSRLLLGEVSLYQTASETEPSLTAVATCAFTVTTALDGLLAAMSEATDPDATANVNPLFQLIDESPEGTDHQSQLNLALLNLVATPKVDQSLNFRPVANRSLPPQIRRADAEKVARRTPQLPVFPHTTPDVEELPESAPDANAAVTVEQELIATPTTPETAINSDDAITPTETQPSTPTGPASKFQSLKLQDRFLTRLNALATDAELSEFLKQTMPPPPQPAANQSVVPKTSPHAPGIEVDDMEAELPIEELAVFEEDVWTAREIVVEADPIGLLQNPTTPVEKPLAEDEPIPMPELEIPSGELVAGKPITVRVKLPISARTYVKLWINDRQTRSLIDGPRSIINFTPDGSGHLEATLQLVVPLGSIEIQFEAIAIELQSQRESRKATVNCPVVPPDLPVLALEDV